MDRTLKVPSRKSNETSRDTDSKGKGRQKKPKDRSELAESDIAVPDVGYRVRVSMSLECPFLLIEPTACLKAVFHLPHSRSQGDIPLYASTSAQEPTTEGLHLPHSHSEGSISLYLSILEQRHSVVDLPAQSDIIIAYVAETSNFVFRTQNINCSVIGPSNSGKSTVSWFHVNLSMLLIRLRSSLIKLLDSKRLESAMVWNLVLKKFKVSDASTSSEIVT